MAWHHLAVTLGLSLQRCKRETTSTEFVKWQEYFRRDLNIARREDYYWAQCAAEMRRTIAKSPLAVRTDSFLIKFETKDLKKKRPPTQEEIDKHMALSKAKWACIANMKSRKPPPQKGAAR